MYLPGTPQGPKHVESGKSVSTKENSKESLVRKDEMSSLEGNFAPI